MKKLVFISLLVLFMGCRSIYFAPTQQDVEKMKSRWENYPFAELDAGYHLYLDKCSGCHNLYEPRLYAETQWIKILPEMSQRAHLDSLQHQEILKYLITMREPAALFQKK